MSIALKHSATKQSVPFIIIKQVRCTCQEGISFSENQQVNQLVVKNQTKQTKENKKPRRHKTCYQQARKARSPTSQGEPTVFRQGQTQRSRQTTALSSQEATVCCAPYTEKVNSCGQLLPFQRSEEAVVSSPQSYYLGTPADLCNKTILQVLSS